MNDALMKRSYLAFDLETAKVLPKFTGDLLSHRPLGITSAGTLAEGDQEARLFFSTLETGKYESQMGQADISGFVDFLLNRVNEGYTIVTHNGLGFDFDVLAEESGRFEDCRRLALAHVDMMFHLFCAKGFGVGLDAAARAIGLGKPPDIDGSVAPQLWKDGEHQRVLDYLSQDCRITLAVAVESEKRRSFQWITQRSTTAFLDIPQGWLTVEQAMQLPLPDTSWMEHPWPRSRFTGWLTER
jgi:hypothetical protein